MSLKEDALAIKQEIDNEEKFLTAFVKAEKFVKKYKIAIMGVLSAAVLGFAGYKGYGYYNESRIAAANDAYLKLVKNQNDKEALNTLKEKSKPLFDAYTLHAAIKNKDLKGLNAATASQNKIISDIAAYELAVSSGDADKLAAYATNKDAFYKDLALFVLANKYIEKGEYKKAGEALAKISASSEIKEYASYLNHSIITFN